MVEKFAVNAEPSTEPDKGSDPLEKYFANQPRDVIGSELFKQIDNYYNFVQQFGRLRIWRRSYDYYNRGWLRGGRVGRTGQQDEYWVTNVNEFRNILLHLLVSVTANKLAYESKATNTDYKSQAQTIVANGVLENYTRVLDLDSKQRRVMENALVFSEGAMVLEWDTTIGPDYMVGENGEIVKQGDLVADVLTPMDLVRDVTLEDYAAGNWVIVRRFRNRYDMMAKYPDLADRISNLSVDYESLRNMRFSMQKGVDTDNIPVWTFYHKQTSALPNGRVVEFMAPDIISIDAALPYSEIPVYRAVPDEQIKSTFGYTVAYDLLPLQEALDGLYSVILTNQATFGVQNIAMPTGANISVNALGDGMNLITYDPKFGAPSALNLVNTPKEIFDFINIITSRMETIAGINSVVRGNPEASLKSGAALALVASQAIQFNSGFQQAYAKLAESVGTAIINILKRYAKTPRMMLIAGKSHRTLMDQFSSDDIADISRVTVELGNPLSRTIAGKLQIADSLLQSGLIKAPEEYITVATTGRLEPLVEGPQLQNMLVKSENEQLAQGAPVQALVTDDHKLHILEHGCVLASPEARQDPMVVNAALAHIQEHITLLQTGDPTVLALNGQPAVAPPSGALGTIPPNMAATNPVEAEAAKVNMPSMPTNPVTGNEYQPGAPA